VYQTSLKINGSLAFASNVKGLRLFTIEPHDKNLMKLTQVANPRQLRDIRPHLLLWHRQVRQPGNKRVVKYFLRSEKSPIG